MDGSDASTGKQCGSPYRRSDLQCRRHSRHLFPDRVRYGHKSRVFPDVGNTDACHMDIWNKYNQVVTSIGSSRLRLAPPASPEGRPIVFEMRIDLQIEAGSYSVVVNLGHLIAPNQGENLDSSDPIGPIVVHWDYEKDVAPFFGMCGLPAQGVFKVASTRG